MILLRQSSWPKDPLNQTIYDCLENLAKTLGGCSKTESNAKQKEIFRSILFSALGNKVIN